MELLNQQVSNIIKMNVNWCNISILGNDPEKKKMTAYFSGVSYVFDYYCLNVLNNTCIATRNATQINHE